MQKLRPLEWLALVGMAVFTYLWILYDQELLPVSWHRTVAFVVVAFGQILGFFALAKPAKPVRLAHTLVAILIPLFITVSLVLHLLIYQDGFQMGSVVLWGITTGVIYVSSLLYNLFIKR